MALSFGGAPVYVRLSLVPAAELFNGDNTDEDDDEDDDVESNRGCYRGAYDGAYGGACGGAKALPYTDTEDGVDWPSDLVWAEAERMLSVTTSVCVLTLSAAWCLMLLTVLGGVLGIKNILSGY